MIKSLYVLPLLILPSCLVTARTFPDKVSQERAALRKAHRRKGCAN